MSSPSRGRGQTDGEIVVRASPPGLAASETMRFLEKESQEMSDLVAIAYDDLPPAPPVASDSARP
jgi:hypothetical protein